MSKDPLNFHQYPQPGKIGTKITKKIRNRADLGLAYTPGVAVPCMEINANIENAFLYTNKGNTVAIISNGTAVLGLGDIGALAGKPVMEGKSLLLKYLAGVDSFDVEIDEKDPSKMIEHIKAISCTFGGINLEDVSAPSCFEIDEALTDTLGIPFCHDDQHGTAVVTVAAVTSGLKLINKKIEDVKIVFSGAGAASMACANLLNYSGAKIENIYMCDSKGLINTSRNEKFDKYKAKYAVGKTENLSLAQSLEGADVFIGLSKANLVSKEHVMTMAKDPIILGMANPTPEILPTDARDARPDAIVGSGRSDFMNQVNNVLCFPFLFRGALDVQATSISMNMKIACVDAIIECAQNHPDFSKDRIMPNAFDPTLLYKAPKAIAEAAIKDGINKKDLPENYNQYLDQLVYDSSFHASEVGIPEIGNEDAHDLVRIFKEHKVTNTIDKKLFVLGFDEIIKRIPAIESGIIVFDDFKVSFNCDATAAKCNNIAQLLEENKDKNLIGIIASNELLFSNENRIWYASKLCTLK